MSVSDPVFTLSATIEHWPIAGEFRISRGSKTNASVIVVTISDGTSVGRGECVPYARYGETLESVRLQIQDVAQPDLNTIHNFEGVINAMPAGAARNALDCALWDLKAKKTGRSVADQLGYKSLRPVITAFTLSLGTPDAMAQEAHQAAHFQLLKIKLGGAGDDARMRAIRKAVPNARLIVDANEAWSSENLEIYLSVAKEVGVELIEQPLPQGDDEILAQIDRVVPICADESAHTSADIAHLTGRYDAVNIKLDKTGGLTEALKAITLAKENGLKIMIGCMVGTSLAMAPGLMLAQHADWVDLDGPLLLAKDREPALNYHNSLVYPPSPDLWG